MPDVLPPGWTKLEAQLTGGAHAYRSIRGAYTCMVIGPDGRGFYASASTELAGSHVGKREDNLPTLAAACARAEELLQELAALQMPELPEPPC